MHRFIMNNWQTILVVYAVVATIVFVAMGFFWVWIIRAEEKERELYPEEYDDDVGNEFVGMVMMAVASVGCALLWVGIPVILAGVMFFDWVQKTFPKLMGNMYEDIEEEKDND